MRLANAINIKTDMIIEHITYDESRGGRSTSREASGAQPKLRKYFSKHTSRSSGEGISTFNSTGYGTKTLATAWNPFHASSSSTSRAPLPSRMNQAPIPNATKYLIQQHSVQAREANKDSESARSSGSSLPLEKDVDGITGMAAAFPATRPKGKSAELFKEKMRGISIGGRKNDESTFENSFQPSQKDGSLYASKGILSTTASNPFMSHSSSGSSDFSKIHTRDNSLSWITHSNNHMRETSQTRKTGSRNIVSYINTSADMLEETRRELKGKLYDTFEYLNYPSFSLSRRASISSSDSSFYCLGAQEVEQEANTNAAKQLTAQFQKSAVRLAGVHGDNIDHVVSVIQEDKCRLCKKSGASYDRGLCIECEREFSKPVTKVYDLQFSDDEEEMKPTPPLKDIFPHRIPQEMSSSARQVTNPHAIRKERRISPRPLFCVDSAEEDTDLRPLVPAKDDAGLSRKDVRFRPVVEIVPQRQSSQSAEIVDGEEDEFEKNQQWRMKELEEEYQNPQQVFRSWRKSYEKDEYNLSKIKAFDSARNNNITGYERSNRHSSFYGFWDNVLEENIERQ